MIARKREEEGEEKDRAGRWLVPALMPLRGYIHSLMLPYIPHGMTWEICGVTIIIPSQIL